MIHTSEQALWIHGYVVEPADSSITGPRGKLQVQPAAMLLLLHLADQTGDYVDEQAIIANLERDDGPGPHDLETLVHQLRASFDDLKGKPLFIQQSDKKGYRLAAPALPADEQSIQSEVEQIIKHADEQHHGDKRSQIDRRRNRDTIEGGKDGEKIGWLESLNQRRVFRVLASYAVGSWLVLQITDVLAGAFPVPNWTTAAVVTTLAIGFPIVAALAWAFQMTPRGVVLDVIRDEAMPADRARVVHFLDLVIIGVLLAAVAVLSYGRFFPSLPLDEHTKIAVLPFQNLSEEADGRYLSEGLSDDIRARLYEIPQLLIAAKVSTNSLTGKGLDIQTIGERLTVKHVLDGSVRRVGDRLRVAVQLIDVDNGFNRWSKTYDTNIDDVLEVQNSISLFVASELEVLLTKELRRTLAEDPTDDPAAYDAYLRARSYLNRPRSTENLDQALILFREAIDHDPSFALGFAGLCQTFIGRYLSTNDTAFIAAAETNCQHALELDPELDQVHIALGQLYTSVGKPDEALERYNSALEIDPKSVAALTGLGKAHNQKGNYDAAETHYRSAVDARPGYWSGYNQLARFLISRGRFVEAIENYRRVIAFTPDNAHAFNNLGTAYYLMGDFGEAAVSYKRSLELKPGRAAYSNTGTMYYYAGDYVAAAEMFKRAAEEAANDYRLWGNLADAQRFISEKTEQSQTNYRKAIKLALSRLEINPNDIATRTNLAFYYANTGEAEKSEQTLQEIEGNTQKDAEQEYIKALTYAVLGNSEKLQETLATVKLLGFPQSIIDATPELKRQFVPNTQSNNQ